ncbi:hypothetical protein ACWGTO_10175 [Mesorhizobium sp. PL10]
MSVTGAYPRVGLSEPSASSAEALLHISMALIVVALGVSAFAVWTPFGIVVTFIVTLIVSNAVPAGIPVVIICAFLYQNLMVAWYTPYIPDNDTFDALRGTNFIILMTAFCIFLAASFQHRVRALIELRSWLLLSIVLCGTICFYFALGAVHGGPKDAVVYFRNTITPLACFHIAVLAASLYPIDLRKSMLWLGAGAVIYGYVELTFTMNFLGLFHGDLYIERNISRQIETGVWEKALKETGFVFRGLEDVMTTTFFNTPFFNDILPTVFRIGGPNFHSISYAYALSIISAWLLFRGRWLLPIAALPLLAVIGSKGATFMLLVALCVRLFHRPSRTGLTVAGVIALAVVWTTAAIAYGATHGDYHVLGLAAGIRDFLANPLGQGLGLGGNLSSTSINLSWSTAQAEGAASVPVESAVGVMLYQMGIGSLVFFGFLAALAMAARRQLIETGDPDFLFGFVGIVTISANAVLQEEAFYSPLALAFCLLLVGVSLGTRWRELAVQRAIKARTPQAR